MAGLGVEALQAASTKASIGLVGVGIEEEAATTEPSRLLIPLSFPKEERQAIEEMWKSPLFDFDESTRPAVRRLVTDRRMRDLRKKLPEGLFRRPSMHSVFFPYCDENRRQESEQPGGTGLAKMGTALV